jgi:hypothetical protein
MSGTVAAASPAASRGPCRGGRGYAAARPGETAAAPRWPLEGIKPIRMGIILARTRRHHRMHFALKRKIFTCHVRPAAGPFRWDCIALLCPSAWRPDEWREAPYEANGFRDLSTAMICVIRGGQIREAGPAPRARRPSGGFAVGRGCYLRSAVQQPPQGAYSCGGRPIMPGSAARRAQPPDRCGQAGRRARDRWLVSVSRQEDTQSNIFKFVVT